MKNLLIGMLALAMAPLTACQTSDLGSGANTVDREYTKPAPEVWKAAVKSAKAANLNVTSDKHDQLGGELVASRADGSEVLILVKSVDERNSRLSIRVGSGDRELANVLQERVAAALGMGSAKAGWFGGNSLEATYQADLDSSTASAHRTFTALDLTQTDMEHHATSGRIDGRQKDSTPVRITLEKVGELKTRVIFIAGNAKSDDNKAFAQKMKDEFETTTRLEVSTSR